MINFDISNSNIQDLVEFADENIEDFKSFDIAITFKSDYSQSRVIRSFVLYIFEKNDIDAPWNNRFSLMADELVNNSIEY
jgi:hypothetical protein